MGRPTECEAEIPKHDARVQPEQVATCILGLDTGGRLHRRSAEKRADQQYGYIPISWLYCLDGADGSVLGARDALATGERDTTSHLSLAAFFACKGKARAAR